MSADRATLGLSEAMKELLQAFSRDVIATQQLLDEHHLANVARFDSCAPSLARVLGPAAFELQPQQQLLRNFTLSGRFRLRRRREHELNLSFEPINLGYRLRYGKSTETETLLHLEIEQIQVKRPQRSLAKGGSDGRSHE